MGVNFQTGWPESGTHSLALGLPLADLCVCLKTYFFEFGVPESFGLGSFLVEGARTQPKLWVREMS